MSFISGIIGGQAAKPAAYSISDQNIMDNMGGQADLVHQLQNQAAGNGPSAANQVLQNATQSNAANANALAASQRGINPGLALRQAMASNANANQAAQGQAQAGRQQEMLNATGQLGSQLNTQVGQGLQSQQQNASIAAGVGQSNAANSQSAAGGLLGGVGAMLGLAEGGEIPALTALPAGPVAEMKSGGGGSSLMKLAPMLLAGGGSIPGITTLAPVAVAPDPFASLFKKKGSSVEQPSPLASAPSAPMSQNYDTFDAPVNPLTGPQSYTGKFLSGLGSMGSKAATSAEAVGKGIANEVGNIGSDLKSAFALSQGGKVPAVLSPGERYLDPKEVQEVKSGKKSPMKVGEKIPGKPKVGGAVNSYANDNVPKNLDAGGVVLPRSVTLDKDAEAKARAFIAAIDAKKKAKK